VVGDVISNTDSVTRGVIWRGADAPVLLQTLIGSSPWTVSSASGVNNRGDIAAMGTIDSRDLALLLVPAIASRRTAPHLN
jgi:hypothetical protein